MDEAVHRAALALAPDQPITIEPVAAGASGRHYWRVTHAGGSAIACAYEIGERPEYATYGSLATALHRHGIPVPQVLAEDRGARRLWLEDCGDLTLRRFLADAPPQPAAAALEATLAVARILHSLPPEADLPICGIFDDAYYRWEQNYFFEHLAAPLLDSGTDGASAGIKTSLATLRHLLGSAPLRYIHRDLQSDNVMIRSARNPQNNEPATRNNQPAILLIDFQSMRLGNPAYDVASLLLDPYHPTEPGLRATLLATDAALRGIDVTLWQRTVSLAAVQRLLQALGAYGRYGLGGGNPFYRSRIPVALGLLAAAAAASPETEPLAAMARHLLDNFEKNLR